MGINYQPQLVRFRRISAINSPSPNRDFSNLGRLGATVSWHLKMTPHVGSRWLKKPQEDHSYWPPNDWLKQGESHQLGAQITPLIITPVKAIYL